MNGLSRRESQIMDVVYAHGAVTVNDVLGALPDPPSYSSVRALMRILEQKGHLQHDQRGTKYVYSAVRPRRSAGRAALNRLLRTFFDDSPHRVIAALLETSDKKLSSTDLDRLADLIEQARREREKE